MKKLFIFVSLTVAGILGLADCAGDGNTNTANINRNLNTAMTNTNMTNVNANRVAIIQDNFWSKAAQGGMAEVGLSKVAAAKSQNGEVKKFANMMIADHNKANTELKALAAKKTVTLPTEVDSSHKSKMDELNGLTGADFDKTYIEAMVEDHEATVDLFEDAADDSDADIKAFAAKTLPTLKSHLEMIKGIQSKLK